VQQAYVNRTTLVAYSLWFVVSAFLAAAWLVIAFDLEGLGYMLALTAGVLAPMAAVAHLRIYTERVCNLIRNTASHDSQAGQVRSMR
jgi:hypothetical protein